ncbi:MAG: phytanoyl-CoA dioxygenase family protein [Spirochaetales bacterium]|nr:phytanoyl-CoA dioxygenase family protein [Spirochaetales bacterium]
MNTHLTEKQIKSYRKDGCLVYKNLLDETEIEVLLSGISTALEEMGSNKVAGSSVLNNPKENKPDAFYDSVFLQKLNLWKISDAVKKIFLGPEIGEMICKLEGIDGVRVWHDQTLQKRPWSNPTGWHLDNPFWSFYSMNAISIWVALDDATVQNGCLYYIPGSHKQGSHEKHVEISSNFGSLFKTYPEWASVEPVSGEMKRGDCGFHNGLTAHGAGVNNTPYPRRAMTCGYMPDGSTFNGNKNILPKDYIERLKVGDLLNNEEQNPLIWPVK